MRTSFLFPSCVLVVILVACRGGGDYLNDNDNNNDPNDPNGTSASKPVIATGGGSAGSTGSGAVARDASVGPGGGGTCSLPKVSGPCDAAMPRFWFNSATKRCESFTYGGCEGNANNFQRASDCVEACAPGQANACDTAISCPKGAQCVFLSGSTPECAQPCPDGDAGTGGGDICPFGNGSCECGASCPSCKNCLKVCAPE